MGPAQTWSCNIIYISTHLIHISIYLISTLLDCRSVSVDNCRFHLNITSTFSLFNSSLYLFLCFCCRPVGGYLNSRNWNGHQEVRLYDGGHLAQWLAWPPHTNIWSDLQSGDVEKSFIFHCWFQIIKINEEGWRWWGGEAESRYGTTEEARSQSLGKLWPHQTMTRGHWVSSHTHQMSACNPTVHWLNVVSAIKWLYLSTSSLCLGH